MLSRSERVYSVLLLAYPRTFRARSGREMQEAFRDCLRQQAVDGTGFTRLWARTVIDVLVSAVPEHIASIHLRIRRSPQGNHQRSPRGNQKHGRPQRMDELVQDLRYALRAMIKRPVFAGVVIATLALGIGANTAIFSLINEVLLRPLPITEPERVVALYTDGSGGGGFGTSSYPDYVDFREQTSALEDLAAYNPPGPVTLSAAGSAEQINATNVTGNYFGLLGVQTAVGRLILPEDDVTPGAHPVAVLGYTAWQTWFGGEILHRHDGSRVNTESESWIGHSGSLPPWLETQSLQRRSCHGRVQ